MLKELMWIAVAGAIGTLCRYWLSGLVQKLGGASFPWGTFAVNASGCLLFGLMWSLCEERMVVSGQTRMIVLTGFMGAFTTFSTFAFESAAMLEDSQWTLALVNAVGQNLIGISCILIGLAAGRWL